VSNVKRASFRFGRVQAVYGKASMEYLDTALALLAEGTIDCLVTCPISKEAVHLAGYRHFSGHTEYLAARSGSQDTVMMLLNDCLKFSLVTRHIPLENVAAALKPRDIRFVVRTTHESLQTLFSIRRPRLGVCAVNPHASDNGLIGDQENRVLKPVIRGLQKRYKGVCGPEPADSAIAKAVKGGYDALIAMYHDQALIPLKLTGAQSGVNITLGLPYVRTSPLHGTAFDIAGKGVADPSSLLAAIRRARQCAHALKKA